MKEFDLNIEKVLENWTVAHALREIIANALDEQILTNSKDIAIYEKKGKWIIRDYGRGLQYIHFTQNENEEKLAKSNLIGKFGVGLKDALATFDRHNISVVINSRYGQFTIGKSKKHGFSDIKTLHAYISKPISSNFIGTEFIIDGCTGQDILEAKNYFLKFANLKVFEKTSFGEILEKRNKKSEIFINGIKVAEEENFLFSYNITSLNASLRKAINRERTNVGRSAYSDRIRSILLSIKSDEVVDAFTANLQELSSGNQCDEMKWVDVQAYTVKLLSARKETVFVTPDEIKNSPGSVLEVVARSGRTPIFVPETVKKKIESSTDVNGNTISTIETLVEDYNNSFEYEFVDYDDLDVAEKENYDLIPEILKLAKSPMTVDRIFISNKLKQDTNEDVLGLYERDENRIIILRKQLMDRASLVGTLIHELTHADSGYSDVSRGFESSLTKHIGNLGSDVIELRTQISKKQEIKTSNEEIDKDVDSDEQSDPASPTSLLEDRAYEFYQRKLYQSALQELDRAKKLGSHSAELYNIYNGVYFQLGNMKKALSYLEEGMKYHPDDKGLFRNYCAILAGVTNEYSKVIKLCNDKIKNNKAYDEIYYLKAFTLLKMQKIDEAFESIEKAVELNPDNGKYQRMYGVIGVQKTGGINLDL